MRRKIIISVAGLSMGVGLASTVMHVPFLPSLIRTRQIHADSLDELKPNFDILARANNEDVKDGHTVDVDFPTAANNLLGYAAYFHIFANSAHLTAHVHGNLAVGMLSGTSNFGTGIHKGTLEKDIHYIQNLEDIPNSSFIDKTDKRDNKVVFGNTLNLDVSGHKMTVNGIDLDHLTKEEIYQDKDDNKYIDFASVFSSLRTQSMNLYQRESSGDQLSKSDFPDENNRVINLRDYTPNDDNEIIINLSADVLTFDRPITIDGIDKDKSGTTVIINVDTEGDNDYDMRAPIKIIYNDGDYRDNKETDDFDDNHLLWNFYDSNSGNGLYSGTINMNATFQGSVLAPDADVIVCQNLDGNIVANNVNIKHGETHRWDLQDSSEDVTVFPDPDPEIPGKPGPVDPNNPGPIDPETPDPETPDPSDPDPDDIDIDEDLKPETEGGSENPFPGLTPDPDPDNEDGEVRPEIIEGSSNNPLTTTRVEELATEVTSNTPKDAVTSSTTQELLPKTGVSKSGVLGFIGATLMTIIGTFGYKSK